MPKTLRIFVVDDHDVVRDGLRLYLDGVDDLAIIGEAATAREGLHGIERLNPDVAIVDAMLPDGDGIGLVRSLALRPLRTRFVVFTTFQTDDMLLRATMAGASGYLLKDAPRRDLLTTLRAVGAGTTTIDRSQLDELRRRRAVNRLQLLPELTAQEWRIVDLIAEGSTNREIGERLCVTEKTVRNYVSSILAKVGMRNRTEIAVHVTNLRSQRRSHTAGVGIAATRVS